MYYLSKQDVQEENATQPLWKQDVQDDTAAQPPWKEDIEDDTTAKPPWKLMHLRRPRTPLHIKVAENLEQIACGEDDVVEKMMWWRRRNLISAPFLKPNFTFYRTLNT